MDIKEKQARWAKEKPLFEAEFIHSHLLPFFNFNENTGDYEIKVESIPNTDDEDRKVAYETLNTGWAMWLRAKNDAKAQAVPKINGSIQAHELTISEIKAEIEEGYDLCQDIHLLDALVERGIQIGKTLAVPEGFVLVRKEHFESLGEFKDLYKRAIINAKKRKDQLNWAHVAGLGTGSGRAVDLCKSLGIDPGATNMHVVEAQEQSHDSESFK